MIADPNRSVEQEDFPNAAKNRRVTAKMLSPNGPFELIFKLMNLYMTVLLIGFLLCFYVVIVHEMFMLVVSNNGGYIFGLTFLIPFGFVWANLISIVILMGRDLLSDRSFLKTGIVKTEAPKRETTAIGHNGPDVADTDLESGTNEQISESTIEDFLSILTVFLPALVFLGVLASSGQWQAALVTAQKVSLTVTGILASVYLIKVLYTKLMVARKLIATGTEESTWRSIWAIRIQYATTFVPSIRLKRFFESSWGQHFFEKAQEKKFPGSSKESKPWSLDHFRESIERIRNDNYMGILQRICSFLCIVLMVVAFSQSLGMFLLVLLPVIVGFACWILLAAFNQYCGKASDSQQQSNKNSIDIFELKAWLTWFAGGLVVCILALPLFVILIVKQVGFGVIFTYFVVLIFAVTFWTLNEEIWLQYNKVDEQELQNIKERKSYWTITGKGLISAYAIIFPLVYILLMHVAARQVPYGVPFSETVVVENATAKYPAASKTRIAYEGCDIPHLFGERVPEGMGLPSYAFLSTLAYLDNQVAAEITGKYFDNRGFNISLKRETPVPNSAHVSTFILNNDTHGDFVIVAVRGTTADWRDGAEDIGIWTPVVVMQALTWLLPFGETWDGVIPSLLRFITHFQFEDFYFHQVEAHIEPYLRKGAKVVLTGHSLGGGIAMAVGARLQIPAICFSAPNHILNQALLKIDSPDSLYTNAFNVLPDGDLVSRIDRQIYHTQKVECKAEHVFDAPLECHSIRRQFCELNEKCHHRHGGQTKKVDFCKSLGYE